MRKWFHEWQKLNPILAEGEVGEIIGMLVTKTGDGVTAWRELSYTPEVVDNSWPSGTSSPVAGAEYLATAQAMPLANGQFAWTLTGGSPGDHLDLTDPANPTVTAAGLYAITVDVRAAAAHAGKFASVMLSADDTGFGWIASNEWPLDLGGTGRGGSASLTVYLPLGAVVVAYFWQDVVDGEPFTAILAIHKIA